MKQSVITRLHTQFEEIVHQEDDTEYWLARKLQPLLGYAKWSNFEQVVEKAKVACATAGQPVADHFADVEKMLDMGSRADRLPSSPMCRPEQNR